MLLEELLDDVDAISKYVFSGLKIAFFRFSDRIITIASFDTMVYVVDKVLVFRLF